MKTGTGQPSVPILVTGGTGTLGRLVVARLRDAGREVRVLSRGGHAIAEGRKTDEGIEYVTGDLATGESVESAVNGIAIIVHLAGSAKGDGDKARHLARAATKVGAQHLVYISVVGADRIPIAGAMDRAMFGYFAEKFAAEGAVADSGVPWTTLRATQFHDLTFKTVQGLAMMPVIPVPSGFRFQPVDPGEVATRLVELALGKPSGLVPDVGGPRVYEMSALVRGYLRAVNKHRLIVPLPIPGSAAGAFRAGANLTPDRAVGRRTWEDFLALRLGSAGDSGLATI